MSAEEEKKIELCNSSTQTSGLSEVSSEAEEHDIFVTLTNTRGTQTSRRESLLVRRSPDLKELYAMSRKTNEELSDRLESMSISKRESKSARRRLSFGETDLTDDVDDGPLASELADVSLEQINEPVPFDSSNANSRKNSATLQSEEMDQQKEDEVESTTENPEESIEASNEEEIIQEATMVENLVEELTEEKPDTVDDSVLDNPEDSSAVNESDVQIDEVDSENPAKSSETDENIIQVDTKGDEIDSVTENQGELNEILAETEPEKARFSEVEFVPGKHDGRRDAVVLMAPPLAGSRKEEKPLTWHKKEQALRRNLIISPIKKRMKIDLPGAGWSNNLQEFRNLVPPLSKKPVERGEKEEHQVLRAMAAVPSRADPPKPVLRTKHGLADEWTVPSTTTAQHFRHPEEVEKEERRSRSRSPLARSQ